jgi:hypothetical protein
LVLKKKLYKMKKSILKSSNKSFGLLFFVVFTIYSFWPLFNSNDIKIFPLIVGLIFLTLSFLNPHLLRPLNIAWVKFGEILGKIVAPAIMFIIFFLVITPIGLFMRFIGKDLLKLKFSNTSTYWIKRDKNIGSMKRQF